MYITCFSVSNHQIFPDVPLFHVPTCRNTAPETLMALGTAGTLTTATCGRHFWRLWCSESLKMCTLKAPQSRSVEKRGSNPSNWSQVLAFSRECHGIHIDTRYTVFCFRRYRPCTPLRFTYLQASAHVKGCPTSADMGFKRTPPAPNLLCESSWALNDPIAAQIQLGPL